MMISFSPKEEELFRLVGRAADELNTEAWLIGGFVRDKLLGRATQDADIVCSSNGIDLAEAVAHQLKPSPKVSFFKNFGTAHFYHDELDIEFVGARRESYSSESRKPTVAAGSLADDQLRRDFTVNALAVCLNDKKFGEFADPFNGTRHIEEKILVTPADPDITFSDDPLRMLRGIRFAGQLNFTLSAATLAAISDQHKRIGIVSKERIADELNKMVLSPRPALCFQLLYDTGLLQQIFPQMVALAGAEYIEGKGHKDNFQHTLQVLTNISRNTNDLWLRWAAILHDIGKPATKRFEAGHGFTFHGHEVVGARMVPKIFNQLKLPANEHMKFVQKMVALHLRPISLSKEEITDSAIRRLLFDAGNDFDALMTLCEADITSKNKFKVNRYLANFELVRQRSAAVEERDRIRNWQPPVDGNQIMQLFGLQPSRQVGTLKNALKDAILDGIIENDAEQAYHFLCDQASGLGLRPVLTFNELASVQQES